MLWRIREEIGRPVVGVDLDGPGFVNWLGMESAICVEGKLGDHSPAEALWG